MAEQQRRMSKNSRRNVQGSTSNKTAGRIADALWEEYGEELRKRGVTISGDLTNYIEWSLGLARAREPRRLVEPLDQQGG